MTLAVRLKTSIILPLVIAGSINVAYAEESQCIRAYGTASVENFLTDLQHFVATDNRERVAEMVRFPISIMTDGKRLTLRSKDQLLTHYNIAFDPKVKGFIAKQKFSELFCNWRGIMIGRGEIWIDSDRKSSRLRVVAINNSPPWSPEDK